MNVRRGICALSFCVCIAIALVQYSRLCELRRQMDNLKQQLVAVVAENESLKSGTLPVVQVPPQESRELLRLRNEVSLLRQRTNTLGRASAAIPEVSHDVGQDHPEPIPAESWTFSGYATPEAAIQSAAWAMRTGNLQEYLACFTPEGREKKAEEFNGKTELEVQRMLLSKILPTRALRPDRKMTFEDGSVGFPLSSKEVDDGVQVVKEERVMRFRNVGGEWKFAD